MSVEMFANCAEQRHPVSEIHHVFKQIADNKSIQVERVVALIDPHRDEGLHVVHKCSAVCKMAIGSLTLCITECEETFPDVFGMILGMIQRWVDNMGPYRPQWAETEASP